MPTPCGSIVVIQYGLLLGGPFSVIYFIVISFFFCELGDDSVTCNGIVPDNMTSWRLVPCSVFGYKTTNSSDAIQKCLVFQALEMEKNN